jgi:acid stress-induced BolA-like protein IbaG/YrbA
MSAEICTAAKAAIEAAIPGAVATVRGDGGHFDIEVVASAFAGKRILAQQRLVYAAIKDLMAGDQAPMHAVDRMVCKLPA